ncbi:hypothetical protein [Melittangium boletus]|uniref:Lipoprotein n=1 Tax=Melittangium boletus DSM 14713 TaxID=1294270 RepID=A0A250ITD7_9BACT|nr:hypothetical protein [Melittangium boletus]ATB34500.1 hypothetical protein MEBOL_008005 [Melittangium boletus DSM 14713]
MSLHSPLRASRGPALLLSWFALACNNPPPITIPEPPQVVIQLAETNTVGSSFKFAVNTSGCDQVQRLEIFDDTRALKVVPYAGNPTQVTLGTDEIRYTKGIAATLSLSAQVTCADGRSNVSQAQLATFFPVDEVVEPISGNTQIVPPYFVAEGTGNNVSFIGCAMQGNVPTLFRVKKSEPTIADSLEMDFPCDATTIITDRKPALTGLRWLWTRGRGVLALKADFSIAYSSDAAVKNLAVGPDGSAILYDSTQLRLVSPAGKVLWERTIIGDTNYLPGLVAGEPMVRTGGTSTGTVVVPLKDDGADTTAVRVAVLTYAKGELTATYELESFPLNTPFWTAFDDTGSVMYLGTQQGESASVRACALGKTGLCRASTDTRLWITSQPLAGYLAALVPYNNNSRLAVVTANQTWFLDVRNLPGNKATQGGIVNKDQTSLKPNGALVARFVQPGPSNAFYLFTSARGTDAVPDPYPVEIVATEEAEKGVLFRYQVQGDSLYGALDDSGTLWMRVGRKLVKPLSLARYRELRERQ